MRITFSRQTALFITRKLRANRSTPSSWGKRVSLIEPDPSPRTRWTRNYINRSTREFKIPIDLDDLATLDVAVPEKAARLEMKEARNVIYGSDRSLPPRSFIEVANGIAISCPELLFIEMATMLDPAHHLILGYELCGSFSRDAADPRNGDITFSCPPITTRAKIERFLKQVRWATGAKQAHHTLEALSDNAWSPTESVIATMASLPFGEYGYELGPCELNVRVNTPKRLTRTTSKKSRVPDILFADTSVGINYDGAVHLNLDSIVQAAIKLERDPGQAQNQQTLDAIVRKVREKAIDDIRRNRELTADGLSVLPVTKEDLYEEGGLDRVMLQVIAAIENSTGKDMSRHAQILDIKLGKKRRQELIWMLLPETHASRSIVQSASTKSGAEDCAQQRIIEAFVGF